MAKSKLVKANEKIEKTVVSGYKKIENAVVSGYTKIEDKFVDEFLTKDGESVEDAKSSLAVINKIGISVFMDLTSFANSKPSISGIIISETIRSNTFSYMAS